MANEPRDPRLERRRPTDAELDRDADVTEADADAAVDAWQTYAPTEAKRIIDAEPSDDGA